MISARVGNPSKRGDRRHDPRPPEDFAVAASLQYASIAPRSASGSPSVLISQSSTATIVPDLGRMQDRVVETVVAVDHGVRSLLGQGGHEIVAERVERGQVGGLRRLPLLGPPAQLSLHEARRAAELGQPDLPGVDGVEVGEDVDERLADPAGDPPGCPRTRAVARCGRCGRRRAP